MSIGLCNARIPYARLLTRLNCSFCETPTHSSIETFHHPMGFNICNLCIYSMPSAWDYDRWLFDYIMNDWKGEQMTQEVAVTLEAEEARLRQNLELLDRMVGDSVMTPIDMISLRSAQGIVAAITSDLKAHSVLDSILIDRDVRNIVRFLRQTQSMFMSTEVSKTVKKTVASNKKKAIASMTLSAEALGEVKGIFAGFGQALTQPVKPENTVPKSALEFATGGAKQKSPKQLPAPTPPATKPTGKDLFAILAASRAGKKA